MKLWAEQMLCPDFEQCHTASLAMSLQDRFFAISGPVYDIMACPLCATSGCEQLQQGGPLFNHLVGAGEQRIRYGEAECLRGRKCRIQIAVAGGAENLDPLAVCLGGRLDCACDTRVIRIVGVHEKGDDEIAGYKIAGYLQPLPHQHAGRKSEPGRVSPWAVEAIDQPSPRQDRHRRS